MKHSAIYRPEIQGLRGIACLIVLMGHSVACIFPAIYFGNSYQQHSQVEAFIHKTPLNVLFNGSAMVMVFFIISGYLIGQKKESLNIVNFIIKRYIRYLPMVSISIISSAIVMSLQAVNSLRLAKYSYAGKYVNLYNHFPPTIFGKNGVLIEIFVKTFLVGSNYCNVLWYISVAFWGDIVFAFLLNYLNNKKYKKTILRIIIAFLWIAGIGVWQLQYVSGIAMGILIAEQDVSLDGLKSCCCFLIGVLLLSFEDKGAAGIYAPLRDISKWIVPIWCIGGGMALIGIMQNERICKLFRTKLLMCFGKYSFAIYALQWPIIVSMSCGSCLILYIAGLNYSLAGVAGVLVGAGITIGLSIFAQNKIYTPIYETFMAVWNKIYNTHTIVEE